HPPHPISSLFPYTTLFRSYNVAKHSTAREVIKLRREGRRIAIGLITDQSPNRSEAHYWTTFLNQDTVFMDGAERIAKLMDFPVRSEEHTSELQSRFDLVCR